MDKPPEKKDLEDKVIDIRHHTKFEQNQKKLTIPKDLGMFPEAHLITFKKLEPKKKVLERKEIEESEALFQQGMAIEESSLDGEEAISYYQKALELNPNALGAAINLGTIYFRKRQFGYAENLYLQAIKADPEYSLAWFNLGNLHDELGRISKAIECYEEAIKLNPNYADALFNLGLIYDRTGNLMRALLLYQRYIKIPGIQEKERFTVNKLISEIKGKIIT